MKKVISAFIISITILIISGCFAIYRNNDDVDEKLKDFADYIIENSADDIILSARLNTDYGRISFGAIVPEKSVTEQYEIIDSVIIAIDDYLTINDNKYKDYRINVHFSLPVDRFSGVPGDILIEFSNQQVDDSFTNKLVSVRPTAYGRVPKSHTYIIPETEFHGIHILTLENCSNEEITVYLSSWPSIDTVYVSTSEQAEQLQAEYPDIAFFSYN